MDNTEKQQRFRELRNALEWTQKKTAGYIGVTVGAVEHWEQGRRPVPLYALRILKDCLKLDQ